MEPQPASRYERFHPERESTALDHRTPGQRDRDRILYTSAFRRLAGVTQVVSADEGHVFHNRLTHTLEVAQVARRIAEKLRKRQDELAEALGGVDPDVAEAAALAHDLGHPPFGHLGEEELDELARGAGVPDGFEGNPQSFRIVNYLALRTPHYAGVNLTRATLSGLLKYPWLRGPKGHPSYKKRGAYTSERHQLEWTRSGIHSTDKRQSIEAEIMDWADDVTYAVHDMADFYQAGLIPFETLTSKESERKAFLDGIFTRAAQRGEELEYNRSELEQAFEGQIRYAPGERYQATRQQRAGLRAFTAGLIALYVNTLELNPASTSSLDERYVRFNDELRRKEVFMLKELTWHYVILNPSLRSKQHGQRQIIRTLFKIYTDAAVSPKDQTIFPYAYQAQLKDSHKSPDQVVRLVTDLIASMTEQQAVSTFLRLTGTSPGSALDHTIR